MSGRRLRIVIPGGSGQVGTLLARHFAAAGHAVTVLSRKPSLLPVPWTVMVWDGSSAGPWLDALEGSDVCINLAGRSVNCRYNQANRREIYDSRIVSTRLLHQGIASLHAPPRLWMNASTATIYRHAMDRPMEERSGELGGGEAGAPDSWNFSIKVAKEWEDAFLEGSLPTTRRVALRSAVTFSADRGGIFDVLSTLARRGLGGTQGSGSQMVSWLHGVDFVRAIQFLIEDESIDGAVNVAAPTPVPNRQFMQALRHAWRMPVGLPAPAWLIEMGCFLLGTESELVLKSRWVIPGRLEAAGFHFLYPKWPEAATNLVARWRSKSALCWQGCFTP